MIKKIVIINTGSGNMLSIKRAIHRLGYTPIISSNINEILNAYKLILPGVGAFGNSIDYLQRNDLFETIINLKKKQISTLGICLGMQILLNSSDEFGHNEGLVLIKGKVEKIPNNKYFKIPSIGWFKLEFEDLSFTKNQNIDINSKYYFVHSYHATEISKNDLVAHYKIQDFKIPAIIRNKNIMGFQFHLEKSGEAGIKLLGIFLNLSY